MSESERSINSILIVDDIEDNIDVMLEALSDDYDLRVATDGEGALELAFEAPPDLVLLDIMMPGMDGYEVCRRLKEDSRTREVPVIFVSAMNEIEDEMKGFRLGAVDYITKPITPSIVQARVAAHLSLQHKTRQLDELSRKLSKYLAPQVYVSIFRGDRDVRIESTRKKLSIFFSDIVAFTRTTEEMESEDLSALLNNYLEEMANIALKHGGTIDKFIGDAMMVFFGDPLSRGEKEDALSCVSMAIEMRDTMRKLRRRWYEFGIQEPFRIRAGVSTGHCTVGNFGSRNRMDYTIIGSYVNLASRLESAAPPDHILISHATWSLVNDKIYCIKQRPVNVKGIGHPVQTYQVVDYFENMSRRDNVVSVGFVSAPAPTVPASMSVQKLLTEATQVAANELVAVVVEDERPVGTILGHQLMEATATADRAAIFLSQPVTAIMDPDALVVEAETPLRYVLKRALDRPERKSYDPVVVTTGEKMSGVASVQSIVRRTMELVEGEEITGELEDAD